MNCPTCCDTVPMVEERDYDGTVMSHGCPLCGTRTVTKEYMARELGRGVTIGEAVQSSNRDVCDALREVAADFATQSLAHAALGVFLRHCLFIAAAGFAEEEKRRFIGFERTRLIEHLHTLPKKGGAR